LREEAKKSLDDTQDASSEQSQPDNPAATPNPPSKGNQQKAAPASAAARKPTNISKPAANKSTPAASTPDAEPQPSQDAEIQAQLTDLQEMVNSLQASLKTAQQVEQTLRDEVKTLEASLKEQEKAANQLKAELEKAQQNNAELERTKRLVLQLSESNIALTKEMDALKHEKAQPPRSNGTNTATLALRQILQHPILATIPSTDLSDDDIGWVD
jgi:chromosome segregation ATPase